MAHQYSVKDLVDLIPLALAKADISADMFYEVVDLAKLHSLPHLLKRLVFLLSLYLTAICTQIGIHMSLLVNPV